MKLAIIGANEFQERLILKAKELGYETHVFAWERGGVPLNADFFYPISIVEKEEILKKCQEIKIDGITSIASDLAVGTVNYVAEEMGLAGNKTETSVVCTNKFMMREKLRASGIEVPMYVRVSSAEEVETEKFRFPVIVKPTDRSGSRSIKRLETSEGLEEAIKDAVSTSFEKKAIVEEYLYGEEFSCECISYNGEHHLLAVTKKYTTGSPNYIETAHMQPADLSEEEYNVIRNTIFKALDALGICNSASHSEFKLYNGKVYIIEIGARMGGGYIGSDLVYLSTGIDFIKLVIDLALGNPLDFTPHKKRERAYVKFFLTQEDIDNFFKFKENHTIYRESKINYEHLGHITDSSTRMGYYIFVEDL